MALDSNSRSTPVNDTRLSWLRRVAAGSIALISGIYVSRDSAVNAFSSGDLWEQPRVSPSVMRPEIWPTLVPRGFKFEHVYTGRPDGFGGGEDEYTLWFRDHKRPNGTRNPLAIFYTRRPRQAYVGTVGAPFEELSITHSSGGHVPARYYFGRWTVPPALPGEPWESRIADKYWETESQRHNLVFKAQGLMIAVRGSGLTGLSKRDMVQIAENLQFYV